MSFDFSVTEVDIDSSGLRGMMGKDGDVGAYLLRKGYLLAAAAKRDVAKDTGRLAASIQVTFFPGLNPYVMVGSDLDYAYFVHEGTRPHEIAAEPGKIMRFVVRGRVVYAQAIEHPGTKADPFLERHLRKVFND